MKSLSYLIAFLLLSGLASALMAVFQPDSVNGSDVLIRQTSGTTNYWVNTYFQCGGSNPSYDRALVNFNFSCNSLGASFTIQEVKLQLYQYNAADGVIQAVNPLLVAYDPTTVTWNIFNNQYNTTYNIMAAVGSQSVDHPFNITINSTWFQTECQKPASTRRGFMITDGGTGNAYRSSRYATAGERPALFVTYTPGSPILAPDSPTFTYPSADNWHNNTNITIILSHPGADVRYYLFKNDVIVVNNATGSGSYSWLTNTNDGSYTFKAMVQNSTNGLFSTNATRLWTLDTVMPTIALRADNFFSLTNTTRVNQYGENLTLNVSMADETALFAVLVNVTKSGNIYYNYSNSTITAGKTFNLTQQLNQTLWPAGIYTIELTAADSHHYLGGYQIGEYDVSKFLDKITFDTTEGNKIVLSSSGAYSTDFIKATNSYQFNFNYVMSSTTRTIEISSKDCILTYLPTSIYKTHFACFNPTTREGNWIDFEGVAGIHSVTQKDEHTATITITSLPLSKTLETKSIGGLNVLTQYHTWYKGRYISISPDAKSKQQDVTFSLTLTNGTAKPTAANLIYNHTLQVAPAYASSTDNITYSVNITAPTITVDTNITFYWNVTITEAGTPYSINVTGQHLVSVFDLDNCTKYNATAFYVDTFDQSNGLALYTNVTLILGNAHPSGTSTPQMSLTASTTNNTHHRFCKPSDNTTIVGDVSLLGYADGYATKNYAQTNLLLGPTLSLYLLKTSSTSNYITYVVTDQLGQKVEQVLFKAYQILNGDITLIYQGYTDVVGQVLVYQDSLFTYSYNLSKQGYTTKIFNLQPISTSYVIQVYSIYSINTTQDYDKVTVNYAPYSFDDNTANVFNYSIGSNGYLSSYGYTITYPGGTNTQLGTNANGEMLSTLFTPSGTEEGDRVEVDYYYILKNGVRKNFVVYMPVNTNTTNTFAQIRGNHYGMGIFERVLLVVLMCIITLGIATLTGHPVPGLLLSLFIMGYTVAIGFINVWLVLIPGLVGLIVLAARSET